MPQPTGRPNARLGKAMTDMVRSMAIVMGVIAAILLVTWRPQLDAVRVFPVDQQLILAQMQAEFPVLTTAGLSDDWRSTSARWESTPASGIEPVWHVGYVTPSDQYLQFTQVAAGDPAGAELGAFVAEQTVEGSTSGSVEIDGQLWEKWESNERRSLVLLDTESLTVVSGTGDWAEVESYVAALTLAE